MKPSGPDAGKDLTGQSRTAAAPLQCWQIVKYQKDPVRCKLYL